MEEALKAKSITQDNWLRHLDEMTDKEIELMLSKEPDAKRIEEELTARPIPVRQFAEELRDLF